MDVELRHLAAFVAVVDQGSFTAAAATMHVSQASVSRAVAGLEAAIGGAVMHRTSREVGLTELGSRILPAARRVLEDCSFIARSGRARAADLRVGHAWAAVGRHTTPVQQRWSDELQGSELVFVQSANPSSALVEGRVDVAISRRTIDDARLESTLVGVEPRYAAMARSDPLARRRWLTLNDLADRTVAIDDASGTTTLDMWPRGAAPTATRIVRGIEDWLGVIAAGQGIGITAEATTHHYPRPGVVFRPIRDTEPVPVWLVWRRADPPEHLDVLTRQLCIEYST